MLCAGCRAEMDAGVTTCPACGHAATSSPPLTAPPQARDFRGWVHLAIRIAKMEEAAIVEASRDAGATRFAVMFIAIAGIGPAIASLSLIRIVYSVPIAILMSGMTIAITHTAANRLGGKGQLHELFRVQGLCAVVSWPALIPILGTFAAPFLALYQMVLMMINVMCLYRLPVGPAAAVVFVPCTVLFVVFLAVSMALGVGLAAVGVATGR